jgi:hypothetical protein
MTTALEALHSRLRWAWLRVALALIVSVRSLLPRR